MHDLVSFIRKKGETIYTILNDSFNFFSRMGDNCITLSLHELAKTPTAVKGTFNCGFKRVYKQ